MALSGTTPCFHFAHANGFPASSYNTLFSYLPADWTRLNVEQFGHAPRWPVNKNWQNQVAELIEHVKRERPQGGVYAVGHSFGAVISYMAVCEAPELFNGLIMFDPPLVTGPLRHMIRLAKKTPLIDRLTPAGLSKNRCTQWPEETSLTDYFSKKGLFRHMDRRCVNDYVNAVAVKEKHGWTLGFDAKVETAIFRHVPHNLHRYAGRLTRPAVLVTGEQTTVCTPTMRNRFIRDNHLNHQTLPGGHMFPLEHPRKTASFIEEQLLHWQRHQD
ncbi:alpha/beta fold hydrolase [Alteromonas halophila]|uniref:Alpha/beta hydrolase n=1 Tax=Alteromonas halophila TaxID=516698 RepID=A0A918JGX6_9ALTE|nr:alpha/beta hydrolase [Alteromonas halophila]GGW76563.1 alpha/beta hydrolase [Alteromonas halophila]